MLAYGLEYENLMFIMEGLTNLGAMSGDAAALDRIALALGQIQSTGYLAATEMRQLANAYVPIYDIIQESFGLTGEQMANVGKLRLPAEDVINAIVDYANAKFGSVGDAAMLTITGLKNRIVDTIKVLGSEMTAPLTAAWKSFLAYVAGGLDSIRDAYAAGGIGGVFESLVPDKATQKLIRQFLANIHNLFMSVASVGAVAGKVLGEFARMFAVTFNTVAPIVLGVVNALSSVINAMLSTSIGAGALRVALFAAAAGFVVMRVQAVAALVITAVTKAVANLTKMLLVLSTVISKHPILSIIAGIATALVGVTVASKAANNATSGLFDTLSGAGGLSSADILKTTKNDLEDAGNAADAFNNRLGDGADAADKLADGIGGVGDAAKKAKKTGDLLSFDEVFKLNEKDAAAGSGAGAGVAGALDDIAGLMDGLGALGGDFLPEIADFSEYLSSFTDGLFGAFSGLKTVPNMITGFFAGIAKAISKAWGGSLKQVLGLLKSGSIAGFFKNFADMFKAAGMKSLLKGGIIGAAIGFVADWLASMLWGTLSEKLNLSADATGNAAVGQTIGSIIGTVIGGIIGGPAGALIGSAIGTFAGGFVGLFWEKIEAYFDPASNSLSAWVVDTALLLSKWWKDTIKGFIDWVQGTQDIFVGWILDTVAGFTRWWNDTFGGLLDWWLDTINLFSDWKNINGDTLRLWWADTKERFVSWAGDTLASLLNWVGNSVRVFADWAFDSALSIMSWAGDTLLQIKQWAKDVGSEIGSWAVNTLGSIGSFCIKTVNAFIGLFIAVIADMRKWLGDMNTSVKGWFGELMSKIGDWWRGLWDIESWGSGWSYVKKWFSNLFSDIGNWFTEKKKSVKNWWSGLWDGLSTPSLTPTGSSGGGRVSMTGHASGGIFNREHIARFAEGNKAEAIIPLEYNSAMQPFVDAVSNGIVGSLAPVLASGNNNGSQLPPLYVGTLIADDRGIKELYRRFEVIQLQEDARRGITR